MMRLGLQAAPADLDGTFGNGGKVTTPIGTGSDCGNSLAIQSDGKIVVAGYSTIGGNDDFALVRYNSNGTLDTGFGTGGKVTTPVESGNDGGNSIAIQSDSKIVVAGYSSVWGNLDFALVRYNASGTLDTGFGTEGKVTTPIGTGSDAGNSVAIQSDGKIIVAGSCSALRGNSDFAMVRYNANGTLDTGFGSGGKVITPLVTVSDAGNSVALQSNGKIVVAGYAGDSGYGDNFALVQYNTNGTLDTGFGTGGMVTTSIAGTGNTWDNGCSLAIQKDTKILVAGYSSDGSGVNRDFALVRYNANGSLDTAFGTGGQVTTPVGTENDTGYSVAVQRDGKIVVAGYSTIGGNSDFAMVRYNANGTLDSGFGSGGKVTTPIGTGSDVGKSVTLQSDGKIVVAGYSYNGADYDFALVRYEGGPEPDIAVEQPSGTNLLDGGTSIVFGNVTLGNSSNALVFTVKNVGAANLTDLVVTKNGTDAADFAVGSLGATTLAPGTSTTFTVTFTPGAVGSRTAAIQIFSNDGDEKPFDINLTGTGMGPDIAVEHLSATNLLDGSTSIAFGSVNLGKSSNALVFTVKNVGTTNLTDLVVTKNGTYAADFAVGSLGATTLAPDTSTTFTVTFTPGAAGSRTAAIHIYSNDGDENPFDITLTGKGGFPTLGDLDGTFGFGGKNATPIGTGDDGAFSVAYQTDGKIVVAGYSSDGNNSDFALVRYNADGTLDIGFGTGGKVTTPVGIGDDVGTDVALQSDGKIVVAGNSYNGNDDDFALVRYNVDGTLDTGFGTGGKVTTPVGSYNDFVGGIVLQGDGKIVVGGTAIIYYGYGYDFALVRYNANGTLDTGFGTGGKVTYHFGSDFEFGNDVALQSDGKIVVVGESYGGSSMVRCNANGTRDTGFGTVTMGILGPHVALQGDSKIVVAGHSTNGSNDDFALVRYNANGTLDTSFGSGSGGVRTPVGAGDDIATDVTLKSDGKIVVAGYSTIGGNDDFALVRYNANGTLDTVFGTGGKVTTPVGTGSDRGMSVALRGDGKIVVAGYSYNGSDYDFALVRYEGGPEPDIAVEQPTGTNLLDGGTSIVFGNVTLGNSSNALVFTVKNEGAANLTDLVVTKNGTDAADFAVGSLGATTLAPDTSTTFTVTFTPGAAGSRTAAIYIASNVTGTKNPFDITLTGTGLAALQSWRQTNFGGPDNSGDGADLNDFDHDGMPNLLEYAFGKNPKALDAAGITAHVDSNMVRISFPCDATRTDITYTVQASDTLAAGSWTDIAKSTGGATTEPIGTPPLSSVSDIDIDPGLRTVTVTDSTAFTGGKRFLRVKVTAP